MHFSAGGTELLCGRRSQLTDFPCRREFERLPGIDSERFSSTPLNRSGISSRGLQPDLLPSRTQPVAVSRAGYGHSSRGWVLTQGAGFDSVK